MEEIKVEAAGVCILIRSGDVDLISRVRKDYQLFLSDSAPSVTLDITLTDQPYVNDSSWAGLEIMDEELRLSDDYLESRIKRSLDNGSALISRNGVVYGLSTLIRNMFTLRLLLHDDSVVLHAAAIVKENMAYIFLGHSGAGKSTVCELSGDYTILSDDMVIIKRDGDEYKVFPSPCWLDFQKGDRENRGYEIGGIYTLKQDDKTFIREIPVSQALADIFTIAHIPAELQPVQKLFDNFSNILLKYGLSELHFTKDKVFWRHIDEFKQHLS